MKDTTSERMRFFYIKHDHPLPSDEGIFALLRRYPELPTRDIIALLDRDYATGENRLSQLAHQGKLIRSRSFTESNTSKDFTYAINEKGNRNTTQRNHRILEAMVKASVELGSRNSDLEFISWQEMLLSPSMKRELLDIVDAGEDPHLVPLKKGHLHPDGAPFRLYHKKSDQHINVLDEIDRDTEPLTTTKARRSIEEKFKHYHEFFSDKLFKEHYGFQNCILRFFTVDEARTQAIMRLYEKMYGKSKGIVFATIKDWPSPKERSYPKADGALLTIPYRRVGYPDFKLDKFYTL